MKGSIAFPFRRKNQQDHLLYLPPTPKNAKVKHKREPAETSAVAKPAKRTTLVEKFLRLATIRKLRRGANRSDIATSSDSKLAVNSGSKRQWLRAFHFTPLKDEDRESGFLSQHSGSEESERERKSAIDVSANKKLLNRRAIHSFFRLQSIRRSGRANLNGSRFCKLQQGNKSFACANVASSVNFGFDNFGLSLETDEIPVPLEAALVVQDD